MWWLKYLSDADKQLLAWLYEGYTQKEIGLRMSISQQAISKRIKKLRILVVELLEK